MRGEVWTYEPVISRPGQSTLRLIVSDDIYNDVLGSSIVVALHIVDEDPGGLLSVRIGDFGWAVATKVYETIRRRLGERVGQATAEEIDAVDNALRALLGL